MSAAILGSSAVGSGFTLASVTSATLIAWWKRNTGFYKDTALTVPALADSDTVAAWKDQSGNANHLIQASGTLQPLLKLNIQGGYPALRFDGINDYLQCAAFAGGALAQPVTVYLTFKLRSGASVFLYDGTGGFQCGLLASTVWDFFGNSDTSQGVVDNNFHIGRCRYNGASSKYGFDGAALAATSGTVGSSTETGWTCGGRFDGTTSSSALDLVEAGIFKGTLSTDDDSGVVTYLNGARVF